jgi:hypothetical protein
VKNNMKLSKDEIDDLEGYLEEDRNDPRLGKLLSRFGSYSEYDD